MPEPKYKLDVVRVAALARLHLAPDEAEALRPQLTRVLEYVAQLDEVDTRDIEPTRHALTLATPLRVDEVTPGLRRDEVLAQAPATVDGGFSVPKFVESG